MTAKKTKGPESIQIILDRWLKANRVNQRLSNESIFQRWKEVVGEAIAKRSRVVDLTGGVLVIEVDSAPLLHELSTYYRREILESLRGMKDVPNLRDMRFRAGTFENDK